MRLTRQRRQALVLALIVAAALAIGALSAAAGIFDQNLQAATYDQLQRVVQDRPKNQVTIVGIDDATIQRYGRWPLPTRAYADLVHALAPMKPTAIAFDIAFYDPSDRPADDAAFAAEIRSAGNVILAMQGAGARYAQDGTLRYDAVTLPIAPLRNAAATLASVDIVPDRGGLVRRVNLVVSDGTTTYYNLALAAAAMQLRSDPSRIAIERDRIFIPGNELLARTIPLDPSGETNIYWVAPPATSLAVQREEHARGAPYCAHAEELCVVPLADVVAGDVPAKLITNRIVLVGAHSASALPDTYSTPVSEDRMYGVEVWANTAQTILTGRFPLLRDDTLTTLLWLAFVTAAGLVLITRYRLLGFFAALLVLLVYAVVAVGIFALRIAPLGAGVVPAPSIAYVLTEAPFWSVILLLYLQVEEQGAVRNTQRAFGLAVTPEVARHILDLQDSGRLALGGELREATVLFGDIRGFTALSERMDPAELMATLNRYFDGMVEIVERYGGTVNKYNGDNIMVIWGAPIATEDHAWHAVSCALELQRYIVAERQKGGPDVAFGFGINTGELVAGFLGAKGRFEYTVIGDTVNVASRLTSADIARRDNVAVSERTLQAIVPDAEWVDLGEVVVKGRAEPVHCYQVNRIGDIATPNPAPHRRRRPRPEPLLGTRP